MSESFDADSYDSSNIRKYQTENWLYQKHIEQFQACLFELLDRGHPASVLDAGCGEGFVLKYLKKHRPDVSLTGIDRNAEAVAYAQKVLQVDANFHVGDLYDLPFADDSFDTVLCSEVLEHLDQPERAVEELKRVARSHVLITVPREPYFRWLNNLSQLLGLSPDPGHVQFWSHRTFQEFINRHFNSAVFRTKHIYQLALVDV